MIYTGDTGYFEELNCALSNADLLIIECSLFNEKKTDKHLHPDDIVKIIDKSNPNTVLLTHLYPNTEDKILKVIMDKRTSNSKVIIAEDLMKIEI